MPHLLAKGDRIDYWIPRHIIQYCYGTHPSQWLPRGGRRIGMLAIGKTLKDQYAAVVAPVPPQLASLVDRLKTESYREPAS
jgi:hypothetical protein